MLWPKSKTSERWISFSDGTRLRLSDWPYFSLSWWDQGTGTTRLQVLESQLLTFTDLYCFNLWDGELHHDAFMFWLSLDVPSTSLTSLDPFWRLRLTFTFWTCRMAMGYSFCDSLRQWSKDRNNWVRPGYLFTMLEETLWILDIWAINSGSAGMASFPWKHRGLFALQLVLVLSVLGEMILRNQWKWL